MDTPSIASRLIIIKSAVGYLYRTGINPDSTSRIGCKIAVEDAICHLQSVARAAVNCSALVGLIVDKLTVRQIGIALPVVTGQTRSAPIRFIIYKNTVFKDRVAAALIIHPRTQSIGKVVLKSTVRKPRVTLVVIAHSTAAPLIRIIGIGHITYKGTVRYFRITIAIVIHCSAEQMRSITYKPAIRYRGAAVRICHSPAIYTRVIRQYTILYRRAAVETDNAPSDVLSIFGVSARNCHTIQNRIRPLTIVKVESISRLLDTTLTINYTIIRPEFTAHRYRLAIEIEVPIPLALVNSIRQPHCFSRKRSINGRLNRGIFNGHMQSRHLLHSRKTITLPVVIICCFVSEFIRCNNLETIGRLTAQVIKVHIMTQRESKVFAGTTLEVITIPAVIN